MTVPVLRLCLLAVICTICLAAAPVPGAAQAADPPLLASIGIPLGPWNVVVDETTQRAYVAVKHEGLVAIDGASLGVIYNRPAFDLDRPFGVTVDPLRQEVYLSPSGTGPLRVYDAASGNPLVDLDDHASGRNRHMAFDPLRSRVLLVHGGGLNVFDTASHGFVQNVPLGQTDDVAINEQSGKVYVTLSSSAETLVLDADTYEVQATLPMLAERLDANSAANLIYAGAADVTIIDGATDTVRRTVSLNVPGIGDIGALSLAVDESTGCVYAGDADGRIAVLDQDGELLAVWEVGGSLWGAAVDRALGHLYVADLNGRLLVLETFSPSHLCDGPSGAPVGGAAEIFVRDGGLSGGAPYLAPAAAGVSAAALALAAALWLRRRRGAL